MSDFKAKMHQIVFRLGLRPRPPSWISGDLLLREGRGGERRGEEGRGERGGKGRERRGDPLLSRYTPSRYILDKGLDVVISYSVFPTCFGKMQFRILLFAEYRCTVAVVQP